MKLLLATNNAGKVKEYRSLLAGVQCELVTPREAGVDGEVEETGSTFEENARLKAVTLCQRSGLVSLADDSGLVVDALNGEPGIRSARYAGPNANDQQRVSFLLSKLNGVPQEKRTARFVCVIAIALPGGEVKMAEGACEGYITLEPRGDMGFGYDPIFFFGELGKTMAELTMDIKNRVSHRGRAAAKAREILIPMCRG